MAFSRIHNGMHYLTDVLAGGILGFFYGLAAVYLVNYFYQAKRLDKKD
jgi:membrane-associated phospholipid phosphatase